MKCQKCNKNEANVQYREFVNGQSREMFLCSECAAESGLLERTEGMFRQMERRMMNAFAIPFGGSILGGGTLPGSFFGRSFPEIGEFFDTDPVENMSISSSEAKDNKNEEKAEMSMAETVDALKAKLLDAIADERYEDAAKYRDKIKQLKGE